MNNLKMSVISKDSKINIARTYYHVSILSPVWLYHNLRAERLYLNATVKEIKLCIKNRFFLNSISCICNAIIKYFKIGSLGNIDI